MKVLHVESGMHFYGGALQVVFLLEGLNKLGVENVLACPQGSAIAKEAPPQTDVRTLPMGGDLDVALLGRLRKLIRETKPDLITLHSRRGSDIWGALAGRLEGIPVILCRRVDNPESRWIVNIKYRLYDKIITISEGIRRVLISEGVPSEKIHCVLDSVDTDLYAPDKSNLDWFRKTFKIGQNEQVIGMVAQFIGRKGHQTLLDALPAVLAQHPATKVILFGQGPLRDSIQAQINASQVLREHIQLPGFRNDLMKILPCLDVLAHPAYMEGLGVSLLQAAACGVPLVGARAGGIPEIIQPGLNGELIEPGDSSALTHHLNALLDSAKLRQKYGQAARERVVSKFSIQTMVQDTLSVYQLLSTASTQARKSA